MFPMAKNVYVDKDDCTSCNLCADTLPQYFRMDDDDLAESHYDGANINDTPVKEEDMEKMEETIEDCPGECILWKE